MFKLKESDRCAQSYRTALLRKIRLLKSGKNKQFMGNFPLLNRNVEKKLKYVETNQKSFSTLKY